MGPDKNSELFKSVAEDRIPALTGEFLRRNLLSATLAELAELFDEKDNTSHPVTEPTLLGRLVALSQVQRTQLGIAGFEPLSVVDFDGSVSAKAAPHHDQFDTDSGETINTRIIKLSMPSSFDDETVEIFGLNMYQPDVNVDEFFDEEAPAANIVVVGETGKVMDKIKPISGETLAFAIRNKQTRDAKLYKVIYEESSEGQSYMDDDIKHESETKAIVTLPDGKKVAVELLDGDLQNQMVNELQMAIDQLKGRNKNELSEDERQAVSGILDSSGE